MRRVDQWEVIAAVAMHCAANGIARGKQRNVPVGNASAYRIANALDKLARLASTLSRYYVWGCNEDTAPHTCRACGGSRDGGHTFTNCAGAKVYQLEERAEKIGAELGIVVTTQRDPRGAPIKLWADKEDGRSLGVFMGGQS